MTCNTLFIHNVTNNNQNQTKCGTHQVHEPVLPLMYFKSHNTFAHLLENLKIPVKLLLKHFVLWGSIKLIFKLFQSVFEDFSTVENLNFYIRKKFHQFM